MIVCSCNVLSDGMIEDFLRSGVDGCTARDVYCALGCKEQCGRCAQTIKTMIAHRRVGPERGRENDGAGAPPRATHDIAF